jgi:hypothetical protein
MSENTIVEVTNQMDLLTGDVVETTTEVTFEDLVQGLVTEDQYTPYQVATIINKIYAALEIEDIKTKMIKVIPPQMMYIYNSKGYLGDKGNKVVTKDQVLIFIQKKSTKWFQQ